MLHPDASAAANAMALLLIIGGIGLIAILIEVAILRWVFRVTHILEQLRQQTKILQDIRTECWHTREACRTLADLNREP